jgi:hypothetical protein
MPESLIIPAGVIMPRDLLMWLRDRRDEALEMVSDYERQGDDEDAERWRGYAQAMQEVLMHVQYG